MNHIDRTETDWVASRRPAMRYLPVGPGELPVDVKARTIAEVDYPKTGEVFAKKWRVRSS